MNEWQPPGFGQQPGQQPGQDPSPGLAFGQQAFLPQQPQGPFVLDLGETLRDIMTALKALFLPIYGMQLLVGLGSLLFTAPTFFMNRTVDISNPLGDTFLRSGLTLTGAFVAMVLAIMVQGVATVMVVEFGANGQKLPFGEALSRASGSLGQLFVTGILNGLAVGFGMCLCIVPGVFLWVLWSLAPAACVVERLDPIAALTRSPKLMEGNGFTVFGILLCVYLPIAMISFIVSMAVGLATAGMALSNSAMTGIVSTAITGLSTFITAAVGVAAVITPAVIYTKLTRGKEGRDVAPLAEVFR